MSNATRLHAHRLAHALQEHGLLRHFCTSMWDKGRRLPLGGKLRLAQDRFWSRRGLAELDSAKVRMFPGAEILRLASSPLMSAVSRDRALFWQKQRFDRAVAAWVKRNPPAIFVGYEISCARSLTAAKSVGAMTILDLAGLPHGMVSAARQENGLLGDKRVEERLRQQKAKELALADHVLCLSELAQQGLIASGVEPSRISVVPLGTDLNRFEPAPLRSAANQPLKLLFVGGLHRAKGVHTLLGAAARLGPERVQVTLAGPGLEPKLLTGFESIATHIGYVDHENLARLYHEADVFVLPSLWESWGQVTVEAMASGRPAIVSDRCGSADLVTQDNGWVFEAGNEDALVSSLEQAIANLSRLGTMGQAAARRVANLGWAQYGDLVTSTILQAHRDWKAPR